MAVYCSPLAKKKIGGESAIPILSKWKWFSIALCTTVATGILFWGTAEPLYHLHSPPTGLNIPSNSAEAVTFSMSTMFMHWSFTPYAIYTITGLVFALAYYNYQQPFSIRSLLYPLMNKEVTGPFGDILDILCLAALVSGMAASLGAGIFALMGGLEITFHVEQSDIILGLIGFSIVAAFILSAISGLKKGIAVLSNLNIRAFFGLILFLFIAGPTLQLLELGATGFKDYLFNFFSRSTNIGSPLDTQWLNDWTVFYFANWFAWAPISSLFLGRLAVGYTVRDFIHFNLLFPSLFTCLWMTVFSGLAIDYDLLYQGALHTILINEGEENVLFTILMDFPFGQLLAFLTIGMIFISYVTAADSNVSAMSAMSSTGIHPENPEAPIWIKVIWGSLIGLIAWIMITSAGIDGIRLLCVLGGFPALFIIIAVGIGLIKMLLKA